MAETIRVMISSTARDLPEHRQKVKDACLDLGVLYPDMMEHLTATDANALEVSLRIADRADVYIGVIGFRYGYVPDGETISVTEAEYNRAVERGIPRLIFLMSGDKHPVMPGHVETGEGAEKLKNFKARLEKERVVWFFESPDDLKAKIIQALLPYCKPQEISGAPQSLIHTLPTQLDIEGRETECAAIVRAMSVGNHRVYAFAAPGGFGKTALLAKVVQTLSPDGQSLAEKVTLFGGETIETRTSALLHIDCRSDVKLSELFAKAGRLIGQEKQFEDIYNGNASLSDKLQEIFGLLSKNGANRTWFVFDNFESMLNDSSEIADPQLREFFSSVFSGGHNVRSLIVGRDVPTISRREQVQVLETVGTNLFEGLPVDDCVSFLKKNEAAKGLSGSEEEVEAILKEFSERVHRIPMALVWAVGYLDDTSFTLQEVMARPDLFADFEKEQTKAADRYESKGLKRLHFEQLKIQPSERLPMLSLLAFFKRTIPKGALAHLMDEVEMNKMLTRLERNRLVYRKESADAYTRYLNDPLATNLYGLHPVICENEFFATLPGREELYEAAAKKCWERAHAAVNVNRFAYALDLYDCAEKLYEHLVKELNQRDLSNNYALMLMSKGVALQNLTRLGEAITEIDKAIAILEWLVNQKQQTHLASHLANAYVNKGVSHSKLTKLAEAISEYDKAIEILERLVNQEQQTHLANDLAKAYMNKGVVLDDLSRLAEAIAEYDKAIEIRERLVHQEQQTHLASELAKVYVNKGVSLSILTKLAEAIAEYDKATAILERLVHQEQQTHLAHDLALAYMNKGIALKNLVRLTEGIVEHDKAISVMERLVHQEQQTHLANSLAKAYLNKGNALADLTRLAEALAEYDKAIAIRERLINEEQQTHLTNDLALAYLNKALTLEQSDVDEALACYEKCIQGWTFCVEHLNMFWIVPTLLRTLRYRLRTLLNLQRWPLAAADVIQFRTPFRSYIEKKDIDERLKETANKEFTQMISNLRNLDPEQRELLYVELGHESEPVRSLVDNETPSG